MTETIPTSCPDLMNPQTSRCLKKQQGPTSKRWEKMGSKTWQPGEYLVLQVLQPALQFGHISYHSLILLLCLFLYFPQHHRYPSSLSFKTATLFTKTSETQGTAKQQSQPPPSNELNNHKLTSAPKSSKQSLPSLSLLQWFGLLAHELAWPPVWQSQISRITRWKAPSAC